VDSISPHAQRLGTKRPKPGDNRGDNEGKLWTGRTWEKFVHRPSELSTG
jgi:hypothetical protein